ncbi:MrpH family fimbial adhesin [Pseudomonas sp. HLT2-19-2]
MRNIPLKILNSILAIFFLFTLSASGWAVPYLDKPRVAQDKWNTIAYAKVVWPYEDSEQRIGCDTLFNVPCLVKMCIREINGTNCARDMDSSSVSYPKNSTMKEIQKLWVNQYGTVSREFRFKNATTSKCIIMTGDLYDPLPGMVCTPLIAPAVSCDISDSLNFEYGTLSSDQVDKAEAYATLTITCNSKATVELNLAGARRIDLGRSGALSASLHATSRDLADGYSFEGNGTTTKLKITSILHSSVQEAEAGTFKGQGIIVMNIY